ncbi:hypothetical protein ACWGQ5_49680 [Streptomyces sp. NPDC055722]
MGFHPGTRAQVRTRRRDRLPHREIFWTAPSVEIFAYRFLAEARLVLAIHDKKRAIELDPELLAYLAHYVPGSSSE